MEIIIALLACWCLFNTIEIRLNKRDDRRGDVLDQMTLRILKIHTRRLDRIDKILGFKPINENEDDEIN